jgi:predicted RNase H-like HicB family nuclease/Arc/MetJ-type ribon-helix-helix transcriptional regulator
MNTQINVRLPKELIDGVKKYSKNKGYNSIQELIKELLREKIEPSLNKTDYFIREQTTPYRNNSLKFNIICTKGEDNYLIAEVLELNGCRTQAKSYDELMLRIKEAIELYLMVKPLKKIDKTFLSLQQVEVNV